MRDISRLTVNRERISHNGIEDAKPEHLEAGANVLLGAMLTQAGVASA